LQVAPRRTPHPWVAGAARGTRTSPGRVVLGLSGRARVLRDDGRVCATRFGLRSHSDHLAAGARRLDRGVEPVEQVAPIAETGEIVRDRLLVALAQFRDEGQPGACHSGEHRDDR
jgi:hypothetical protein